MFIAFELNLGIRRQSTVLQRDISRRRGYTRRWVNNWGINPAALQLLDKRSQLNIVSTSDNNQRGRNNVLQARSRIAPNF